jgi:hypothetical protein
MTDNGTAFQIDPRRIGREGLMLVGQMQALTKWAANLKAHADKTLDLRERHVLLEVVKALDEDGEQVKFSLAMLAQSRGAGKVVTEDDDETDERVH